MPTWKCKFFARKETEAFYWGNPIENCGLCVNWCEEKCLHQEKLKEQGDNGLGKTNSYDNNISRVHNFIDDGGCDGN